MYLVRKGFEAFLWMILLKGSLAISLMHTSNVSVYLEPFLISPHLKTEATFFVYGHLCLWGGWDHKCIACDLKEILLQKLDSFNA